MTECQLSQERVTAQGHGLRLYRRGQEGCEDGRGFLQQPQASHEYQHDDTQTGGRLQGRNQENVEQQKGAGNKTGTDIGKK